ncbi:MAG: glycogen debranching enzyme, partial [Chromatiales bacterium]|nr:glycogen debranching enzyme [Chromatiales bacterium]
MDATSRGTPHPLGASFCADGVNFSVFSKSAESLELLLFDHVDDDRPVRVIKLDPGQNRTHHYWHVCVAGLGKG